MRIPVVKINGDQLDASEWNQEPTQECGNAVLSSGQSFDSADLYQLAKAISTYAAQGCYYDETGTAVHYILSPVGDMETPISYKTGMRVVFIAGNTNSGTCDINVNSIGVKSIKKSMGTLELAAGDIASNTFVELIYNESAGGWFELFSSNNFATIQGVINSTYNRFGAEVVTTNNYNITSSELTTPSTGTTLYVSFDASNTGAATLSINSGVAYPIYAITSNNSIISLQGNELTAASSKLMFRSDLNAWELSPLVFSQLTDIENGSGYIIPRPADVKSYVDTSINNLIKIKGTAYYYTTSTGVNIIATSGIISSITRLDMGLAKLTFSTAFDNTSYIILVTTNISMNDNENFFCGTYSKNVSYVEIVTKVHYGDEQPHLFDGAYVNLIVL